MKLSCAIAIAVPLTVFGSGAGTSTDPCVPDTCADATHCDFTVSLMPLGNSVAYYEFAECPGVPQPVLGMKRDVTYTFKQYDGTNWNHPLGFAYFTDGAHEEVDELEPSITQSGNACADDNTCDAPMYFKGSNYLGVYNNAVGTTLVGDEDFGLDVYEPQFFIRYEDWVGDPASKWNVKLTLTDASFNDDIFYFCHIHRGMSGRIKLLDANGDVITSSDSPALMYDYDVATGDDLACGTYGLNIYFEETQNGKCADNYLCTDGLTFDAPKTQFNKCLNAMDCAMEFNMEITPSTTSAVATFNHQMIPHHVNAVQMCKALIKTGEVSADTEPDIYWMCWAIINVQSSQIALMQDWLSTNNVDEGSAKCFSEDPAAPTPASGATAAAASMVATVASVIFVFFAMVF